jgi:hypothetical protein
MDRRAFIVGGGAALAAPLAASGAAGEEGPSDTPSRLRSLLRAIPLGLTIPPSLLQRADQVIE